MFDNNSCLCLQNYKENKNTDHVAHIRYIVPDPFTAKHKTILKIKSHRGQAGLPQ